MRNAIAVGICDSSASRVAIRWAMRRASLSGATVELLHVLDPRHAGQGDLDDDARGSALARHLLDREVRFSRSLASGVTVGATLLRGSVMWELARASTEAGLVVVGTHKTGFIHGTVYGSTSLQLAIAAHCPVVVVPGGMTAEARGVVVGADESAAGHAAFGVAAAEASATGQELVIVRVWKATGSEGGPDRDDRDEAVRGVSLRVLSRFAALARAAYPALKVRMRAIEGSSAPALVGASATAQLLVLGSSHAAELDPPVLGAVCHDALMNIVSPTAIVHVDGDRAREGPAGEPGAAASPVLFGGPTSV